eukprot:758822-Hanusia_phi.AAC.2
MTLYNDVKHYEEQKKMKEKVKNEQQRTREELAAQIEERKRQKAQAKEQERRVAEDQRKKYEEWQQEMKKVENEKLQKLLEERKKGAVELKMAQERKKMQAERQMKEEAAIIQQFQQERALIQIEEDKRIKERATIEKKAQYEVPTSLSHGHACLTVVPGCSEGEREGVGEEEAAETAGGTWRWQRDRHQLPSLHVVAVLNGKQENERARREHDRQMRLKAAERMGQEMENKAAEVERSIEERVQRAQEEQYRRDMERERNDRLRHERIVKENNAFLQRQIQMQEEEKMRRKEEERLLAEEMKQEAEAFKREQQRNKILRHEQCMQQKAMLDKQRMMKDYYNEVRFPMFCHDARVCTNSRVQNESAMTEVELRLNAPLLKQVVQEKPDLPGELASKINLS